MSAAANPSNSDRPTDEDPRLTAYLYDLLEVGAAVAQGIKRQAERQAQPAGEPEHPIDLADQFERVSRAMRRTILLARHLAQPRAADQGSGAKPTHHRTQARKRIIRAVEDAIQSEAHPREAEPLRAEFRERLDAPDLEEEVDARPVAEIITDIIRDLGLAHIPGTHPWARRTPRDIEQLRQRAAAPRPNIPLPSIPLPDIPRRLHPPDTPAP